MININKELFDLTTIYTSFNQSQTWSMANLLTKSKFELEELLIDIDENKLFDNHYKEQKDAIKAQLVYVNANIKTLQDALLCHETKIIEKRITLGDLGVFCLN